MEAELVRELPDGRRLAVRAEVGRLPRRARERRRRARALVAERAAAASLLPRAAAARRPAAAASALDGEIVIVRDGALDFDAMQMRLHPAESRDPQALGGDPGRVRRLRRAALGRRAGVGACRSRSAARTLESVGDGFRPLAAHGRPRRGARLARRASRRSASTASSRKRRGAPYLPGSRDGMVKVKEQKTADCVVVGVRWKGSQGRSRRSCSASTATTAASTTSARAPSPPRRRDEIAANVLPLLEDAPERRFSEPNRWGSRRARGGGGPPGARGRGALRQGAGQPLPPRHEAAPARDDKDPGTARGASCARRATRRPDSRAASRRARLDTELSGKAGAASAPRRPAAGWRNRDPRSPERRRPHTGGGDGVQHVADDDGAPDRRAGGAGRGDARRSRMRNPPDLRDGAGRTDPQAECPDERRVPVRLQREHGEPVPRPPEERVVILFGLGPSLAERERRRAASGFAGRRRRRRMPALRRPAPRRSRPARLRAVGRRRTDGGRPSSRGSSTRPEGGTRRRGEVEHVEGSTWRKVTTYPVSPMDRTAYTRSPFPSPPTRPSGTSAPARDASVVTTVSLSVPGPPDQIGSSVARHPQDAVPFRERPLAQQHSGNAPLAR